MMFDVRNTREHVYQLKDHAQTNKKPIHSIIHLGGSTNTILCANLDCLYTWNLADNVPSCSVIDMDYQGIILITLNTVFINSLLTC
jgi:hypothetical protein